MKTHPVRRYAVFVAGIAVISAGVALVTKGSLGTSPITSVPYSLSMVFPAASLGLFTAAFNIVLVGLQALLSRPSDRMAKIDLVLEIAVAFLFGYLVDASMLLFEGLEPSSYAGRIACVLGGIPVIAFGVYLQVVANVVMIPADGFVYALTMRLRRGYGKIRVGFDSAMVVAAAGIVIAAFGTLGGVGEGTVISCILTGTVARMFMNRLGALTELLVPGRDQGSAAGKRKETTPVAPRRD